jgi:hypothetical protein
VDFLWLLLTPGELVISWKISPTFTKIQCSEKMDLVVAKPWLVGYLEI